jgi:hypothetical protein
MDNIVAECWIIVNASDVVLYDVFFNEKKRGRLLLCDI